MRRTSAAVFVAIASAVPSHAAPSFYWANPRPTGAELGGVDFESPTVGYAVGAFGASLRSTDGGVTWEVRTPLSTFGPRLDDVLVLSPGVLLAAGQAPGLYRSTDGGLTFSSVANPGGVRLRNLFALDASTLFAVGDAGRVLRSTDGGATWSLLGVPAAATLVDQWWLDAQHAYVIGESCVRRTSDGGATWFTVPNVPEFNVSFPGDIQFLDAQNGWIFQDFDTYRTTNGGTTWVKLPTGFPNFPIYQEEALVLGPQTRLVATEAEGANIWKTTNDGTSWTSVFEHLGTRGVTDLERLTGGTIVAVTTDGDLLRSTNDGATWSNFTTVAGPPDREDINVLDVHPSGIGFAGGWGTIWIATTDGGRTWFDPPSNPGLSLVFALAVRDPLFALAGGDGGPISQSDVRRTTDGGATWTTHSLSATYIGDPQGLVAFDDGTCFCATYGGTNVNFVVRSTDGGSTWHLRNNGVPVGVRLFDLFFLDSQRGFVCGGEFLNPAIYRTTNGGGAWTPVGESGLSSSAIRDMVWLDENTGIVVSLDAVQRTTNGGASWSTISASGGEAVDFLDAQLGVTSSFQGAASMTTDGGATWTQIALPISDYIADVAMVSTGFLAAGGSNSIVGFDDGSHPVAAPEIASPAAVRAASLVVWPNPVRIREASALHFRIEGAWLAGSRSVVTEVRLYDVGGRLLARAPLAPAERSGSLAIDAARLSPGVVFLEFRGGAGDRISGKVAVIR
jgi:photosystem II stability/assembly factor-like uncharacterized protein